jgi:DNA polymerase
MRPPVQPLTDLQAVADAAAHCRECPLWKGTTQTVWGEGATGSRLMLVGEQPGDHEDLEGRPFVGPAGQLLDRACEALGWRREQLYITNAVKHFKYELRGKRRLHKTPGQREIEACNHWLASEIALVKPHAAVALGGTALRALMGDKLPVLVNRGKWMTRSDGLRVLVTVHPSALLHLPAGEREAAFALWLNDLKRVQDLR